MMTQKKRIEQIDYCEVHTYYPMVIESDLSVNTIADRIVQSDLFIDAYTREIVQLCNEKTQEAFNDMEGSWGEEMGTIRLIDEEATEELEVKHRSIDDDDMILILDETDSSIRFKLQTKEHLVVEKRSGSMLREQDAYLKIYGDKFVSSQARIMLSPSKVRLYGGETTYVNSILFIFENNIAILKLEFVIMNASADGLFRNDLGSYFEEISTNWVGEPHFKNCTGNYSRLRGRNR